MVRSSSGSGRLPFQGADIRFESNTHYYVFGVMVASDATENKLMFKINYLMI